MADLKSRLNTSTTPGKKKDPRYTPLSERLSDASADEIINEMSRLSSGEEIERKPYEPNPQYEQERKAAKESYEQGQSRARTGEVLAHLADAFSRLGAAAYGQNTGTDMSRTQFARPASFEGTKDRNLQEYLQAIKETGSKEELEKEKLREEASSGKEAYGRKFDTLQEALRKKYREKDTGREDARERREQQRQDDLLYREQRKDSGAQERSLASREEATNQLTNELLREDLRGKDKERIAAKLGPVAAKAGVDLNQAIEATEKLKEEQPGWFGRTFQGKKAASAEEMRKNLYNQLKGDLDTLKAQQSKRGERLRFSTKPMSMDEEEEIRKIQAANANGNGQNGVQGQQGAQGQPQQPQAPSAPTTNSGMVKMKAPNGTVGEIPADKVKDAEAKGFTRV